MSDPRERQPEDHPGATPHPEELATDRRSPILAGLLNEQARLVRFRRRRRQVVATAFVLVVMVGAAIVASSLVNPRIPSAAPVSPAAPALVDGTTSGAVTPTPSEDLTEGRTRDPNSALAHAGATATPPTHSRIQIVAAGSPTQITRTTSNSDILDRLAARGRTRVVRIDDTAFLDALAAHGHSAGLVRIGDSAWLVE